MLWPILSGLLMLMLALGLGISLLEGWPLLDGLYFSMVSGLTIGYGDLVPKTLLTRAMSIGIGFTGILFSSLVAAIGVHALNATLLEIKNRSL